jgi:hypothetical protein
LVARGSFEEAEPLLLAACEVMKQAKGAPTQRKAKARQRVIAYYEARGQDEKAEQWRNEGLADSPAMEDEG